MNDLLKLENFDLQINSYRWVVVVIYIICFKVPKLTVADDPNMNDIFIEVGWGGEIIQYRLCECVQYYVMWARSMTLAIRKLKCWVNAILPLMFIKQMNKLVTLSLKHDQRANLKPELLPFLVFARCVSASCIPALHAGWMSDTASINLYVSVFWSDPANVRARVRLCGTAALPAGG